jgi:uncharacterized membrane protein YgcG
MTLGGSSSALAEARKRRKKRNRKLMLQAKSSDPAVRTQAIEKLKRLVAAASAAVDAAELLELGSSPELEGLDMGELGNLLDAATAMDMDGNAAAAAADNDGAVDAAAGNNGAVDAAPVEPQAGNGQGAVDSAPVAPAAAGTNVRVGAVDAAPAPAAAANSSQGPVDSDPAAAAAGAAKDAAGANEDAAWTAVNTLELQYASLSSLLTAKVLNSTEYSQKALPLLERLVQAYVEATGAFPTTLGLDRVFVLNKGLAEGQLEMLRQLKDGVGVSRPSPNDGWLGVDPAISSKTSLLKSPKFWEGVASDAPIRQWLAAVQHWLHMSRVPASEAVGTAANYLRGKAQAYWFAKVPALRRDGKDPNTWDVFRDAMVEGYGAVDPEHVARSKIDHLRQTDSVESYVRELQLLFADLVTYPMNEADKVHKLFAGLSPGLAAKTRIDPATRQPWTSFGAAAAFVIQEDIMFQATKTLTKSANANNHSSPSNHTGRPSGDNHKKRKHEGAYNAGGGKGGKNNKHGKGGKFGNGGGGSNGNNGGGSGSGGASSSRAGVQQPSKAQRDTWFAEKKCLLCGHPDHKKADCPHNRQR